MDLETAQYFTILYGILDVETGEFRYVSAGSPPAILCRKGEAPRFEYLAGYPIGMVNEPAFEEHSLQLRTGDRLYLYTDGVPEAMNQAGEDFGMERFVSTLQQSAKLSLDESLTFAVDQIREWSSDSGLQDDATILGVEFLDS
jgi:sigma-B regulation protein RsbU (phosphoserine phosphatase)